MTSLTDAFPYDLAPARLGVVDLPALMTFERLANDDAWSEPLLQAALIDRNYDVWGVWSTDGARLRATAVLAHLPFDAELQSICVLPDERRHGLARGLLAWILRGASARGAERLLLELRESNLAARRLYEQAGFVIDGQRQGYYRREDGRGEDALLMSRELN
ncbi:GNAT family N-acetyltransferase [Salinicola halimionae]|uniref:GNAT family N-acetyltransferase n=1 Tax=Salinicola halimionae TaxID=1949081 RepID=UPI001FD92872|nr:GNAT family N-acetyltransferase [Salinicola halimionae]